MENEIIITNKEIERIMNQNNIVSTLLSKSFNGKNNYWIARIFSKIEPIMKTFYNTKQEIIKKYAEEFDDNGNPKVEPNGTIKLTNPDDYMKEMDELYEAKEYLGISKIVLTEKEWDMLTPSESQFLLPFITEQVKKDKPKKKIKKHKKGK